MLADPGGRLVARAITEGIPVSAVPGASSFARRARRQRTAVGTFSLRRILTREERGTPRRASPNCAPSATPGSSSTRRTGLNAVLADMRDALEPARQVVVACNLTMPSERIGARRVVSSVRPFPNESIQRRYAHRRRRGEV